MIDLTSRREEEFAVPADELWAVVGNFGALGEWWPTGMLERVEISGEGVGMVRSIHTRVGAVLHEKLESIDHVERALALSIVGDLPAGMQDYQATGGVTEIDAEHCLLAWEGHYKIRKASDEAGARGFIEGAYGTMFSGLRNYVTREA